MPYVDQRWLGGMLTNFKTVKTSIKRLKDMKAQQEAGLETMSKKQLMFQRETEKLEKDIGGIQDMNAPGRHLRDRRRLPQDRHRRSQEAGHPVIGVVDTNHSPEGIDYVIPGNDDSAKAVALYARALPTPSRRPANAVAEVVAVCRRWRRRIRRSQAKSLLPDPAPHSPARKRG